MWSDQQFHSGYGTGNGSVFWTYQDIQPPTYGQDVAPFSQDFRLYEQLRNEQWISREIGWVNRKIAKMFQLAEEEKCMDPDFAEWCHGEAVFYVDFRDMLMHSVSTMYGHVGRPENICFLLWKSIEF